MQITSIIAIYFLFWFLCLFLVLPFRLRTSSGDDEHVPGQDRGAPPKFSVRRTAWWTTVLAALMFGLFYANYLYGWVTPDTLDITPASERGSG
jgi:predicted secreted protein